MYLFSQSPDWAQHGICGRAVLIDLVRYYEAKSSEGKLPYDPWTSHPITVKEIEACAKEQGVTFQHADILLLRVGFMKKWYKVTDQERGLLPGDGEKL